MRAHTKIGCYNSAAGDCAEDLLGLGFHCLLFAAYVGNDIIDYVERRYAGIAGAGECLHCSHHYSLQTEGPLERGESSTGCYCCAVRIRYDIAFFPFPLAALCVDQFYMIGIDLRHEQWYICS